METNDYVALLRRSCRAKRNPTCILYKDFSVGFRFALPIGVNLRIIFDARNPLQSRRDAMFIVKRYITTL